MNVSKTRCALKDVGRVCRAVATNQVARLTPRLYLSLTGQTGRGAEQETSDQVAEYFVRCVKEYFDVLNPAHEAIHEYLQDKVVLEYGPGDILGTALLLYGYGARKVICIDRFPMLSFSPKNVATLKRLVCSLHGETKRRVESCFKFPAEPQDGLRSELIEYRVCKNGLSGLHEEADFAVSRAVLEHVNDLQATFMDMYNALRFAGVGIHLVDLRSHGLHRKNPLDFLKWHEWLWLLMYSHKGVPNRIRAGRYREILASMAFKDVRFTPTSFASDSDIEEVRPYLAPPFVALSDEDLSWLGFWLTVTK